MDISFCQGLLRKQFSKMISVYDKKCYVMIGDNPFILPCIKKLKKNIKKKDDFFKDITDSQILDLYYYISGNKIDGFSSGTQKKSIQEMILSELYITEYKDSLDDLVFITETMIHADDTKQDILDKIAIYCTDKFLSHEYIYCWYKHETKRVPLGFRYEENIIIQDLIDDSISLEDIIDPLFSNKQGEKIVVPYESKYLELFETDRNPSGVFYFMTLDSYLQKHDLFFKLQKLTFEDVTSDKTLSSYVYGVLQKYWPLLDDISMVTNFSEQENVIQRKQGYTRKKKILETQQFASNIIESVYFKETLPPCDFFTISMIQLKRQEELDTIVYLNKIFKEFRLDEECCFLKLILDSHSETYYKLYRDSIVYDGGKPDQGKMVTRDVCKEWSDDYIVKSNYGYNYLHSDNILLYKIRVRDFYVSLVIHLNGDTECIIDNTTKIVSRGIIIEALELCNKLLTRLNNFEMYSSLPISLFEVDVFENKSSPTQLEFMNCSQGYRKEYFEGITKKILPDWLSMFEIFMNNFPMYFRIRLVDEGQQNIDKQLILSKFKKVDNYANMTTIQSMISFLVHIQKLEGEIIIEKLSEIFSIPIETSREEYNSWSESESTRVQQMMMEGDLLDRTFTRAISEPGSEVILMKKNNLHIDIKEIRSFTEFSRLSMVLQVMIFLYKMIINENKEYDKYKILFTEINREIQSLFEDEIIVEDETVREDSDTESTDSDSVESLDLEDDEFTGGGKETYQIKSYYLKRLKDYDKSLFYYKSNKKQKSGVAYGYPKYCQSSDDRMPIVLSKRELQRINDSFEEGSGEDSYSNLIKIKDNYYICPKYWDISKNLSLRMDYIDSLDDDTKESMLIPEKLPPGAKGETENYVFQRMGNYWRGAKSIDYFETRVDPDSELLHPEGRGQPCCFNASKSIGKVKAGEQESPGEKKDTDAGYISKAEPVEYNKYAYPSPALLELFNQKGIRLADKNEKSEGFLKIGVKQNKTEYVFTESPFLNSYLKILYGEKEVPNTIQYIETLERICQNDISRFQRCPFIHKIFYKQEKYITVEDIIYIENVLQKQKVKEVFGETCDKLLSILKDKTMPFTYDLSTNELNYLFSLLVSMKQWFSFLKSEEHKDDTYLLPFLHEIHRGTDKDMNIVILETSKNKVNMKRTNFSRVEKFCFIYKKQPEENNVNKKGSIYEPLLYRHHEKKGRKWEREHTYIFSLSTTPTEKTIKIMDAISSDIYRSINDPFETYKQILSTQKLKDHIVSLYVSNLSEVMYLITNLKRIIPITPVPIPYEKYNLLYTFHTIDTISIGMDAMIKIKDREFIGKVTDINKSDRNIEIDIPEKSEPVRVAFNDNICFLSPDGVCHTHLPRFSVAEQYLKNYPQLFSIKELWITKGLITSIGLSNGTYLPIQPKIFDTKVKLRYSHYIFNEGETDPGTIDNLFTYRFSPYKNECNNYILYHKYEEYMTSLSNYHMIQVLKHEFIQETYFIEDDTSDLEIGNEITFRIYEKEDNSYIYLVNKYDKNYKSYYIGTIVNSLDDGGVKQIEVKISLLNYSKTRVFDDEIRILDHKRENLQRLLFPFFKDIFHLETDTIDLDNRMISICNSTADCDKYPCFRDTDGKCRLIIREKDFEGNSLYTKIMIKFIDRLLYRGLLQNINENIMDIPFNIHELLSMTPSTEIVYSYSEYEYFKFVIKNRGDEEYSRFSTFFNKQSIYLPEKSMIDKKIMKQYLFEKMETTPYFIRETLGPSSRIVISSSEKFSHSLLLSNVLRDVLSIELDNKILIKYIIDEIAIYPEKEILRKYNFRNSKRYTSIQEITDEIQTPEYKITISDIQMMLSALESEHSLGVILYEKVVSQKPRVYFESTNNELTMETPVILLYMSPNESIFSNIIINNSTSITIGELYKKHSFFSSLIEV